MLRAGASPTGRRYKLARELVEKINEPNREIAEVCQQIVTEIPECNLRRGDDQHHAEQKQVHQINDHKRKKHALVAQVGLIFRNHPARESEMERPRDPNDAVKQTPIRLHIQKEAEHPVNRDRQDAVERKEIRRQRDPEVRLARNDMSAVTADSKSAYPPTHQPDPKRMR